MVVSLIFDGYQLTEVEESRKDIRGYSNWREKHSKVQTREMLSLRDSGWKCLARGEVFFNPEELLGIFQVTSRGFHRVENHCFREKIVDLYFLSMAKMWKVINFSVTWRFSHRNSKPQREQIVNFLNNYLQNILLFDQMSLLFAGEIYMIPVE